MNPRSQARPVPATAWALAALLLSNGALAFCRTTTCEARGGAGCSRDATTRCVDEGLPLYWDTSCLTFGVQRDGSPRRGISADDTLALAEEAFARWQASDCAGRAPQFLADYAGLIECSTPEFNCSRSEHNENTVVFRDEDWPHGDDALALTTTTVNLRTGEILDADIELNSHIWDFSPGQNALDVVLTHEVGHLLGLSHNLLDSEATMFVSYNPRAGAWEGLSSDDVAGICSVYPPKDRPPQCQAVSSATKDTECLGGLECPKPMAEKGCSVAPPDTPNERERGRKRSLPLWSGFGLAAAAFARLRRRPSSVGSKG